MSRQTRRDLLRWGGGAAAVAGLAAVLRPTLGVARPRRWAPSEKVTLGIVGVGGRGYDYHLRRFNAFPDVQVRAVCDVYQPHLERAVAATEGKAKPYRDFRALLEQKDLDAVVVATPPHWHALVALDALDAGKDVLCEKPMCRFPVEGKRMADLARRNRRVTQVGTQIHATANYRRCVDVVRSGALGTVSSVTNFCTMNDDSEGLGRPADSDPPPGLDWEMWLGPAPKVPYNVGRFRDGMHRYFRDYVDSWLHEVGVHVIDLPFWALRLGHPTAVAASGGRFATTSIADVPDTMHVLWEFPRLTLTWGLLQHNAFHFGVGTPGTGRHNGTVFHGRDGTLAIVNYGKPDVLDREGKPLDEREFPRAVPTSPGHEREFIDAVRSRKECSCSFANHLPVHAAMNLAHLSLQLGRKLRWDPEKWEVAGDPEATALLAPRYREPWKLPAV